LTDSVLQSVDAEHVARTEQVEFRRFQEEDAGAWTAFVERCDEAWVQHHPVFIQSVPYDHSFSIRINGAIHGVCALGRERRRWGAHLSGPGLALAPSAHRDNVHRALRAKLRENADSARCEAVEFSLPPLAPANRQREFADSILREYGFSAGIRWRSAWEPLPAFYSVINLEQDHEAILGDFSKGQRANVKRCMKLGWQSVVQTGPEVRSEDWADFVRIHHVTYARTGGSPFSDGRLEHLFELVRLGKMVLVNGIDNGRCVMSLLLATDKGGAFYYAGGADDEARQKGAMAWGQYAGICWLKSNAFRHYCVGFTVPALSETAAGGIGDFKKRFGGEHWTMLAGDLILRPVSFAVRHYGRDVLARFAKTFIKRVRAVGQ
jgi:hypothetical protein